MLATNLHPKSSRQQQPTITDTVGQKLARPPRAHLPALVQAACGATHIS